MGFSDVAKAQFYIWKKSNPTLAEIKGTDPDEKVTVQINPSEISLSRVRETNTNKRQGTGQGAQNVLKPDGPLVKNVRINLIFDLVDMYQKIKIGGSKESATAAFIDPTINLIKAEFGKTSLGEKLGFSGVSNISDIDIFTKKHDICCYTALKEAVEQEYVVMFVWGSLEKFAGTIQNFDTTLDYFSPEGAALRASVSLSIEEYFGKDEAGKSDSLLNFLR